MSADRKDVLSLPRNRAMCNRLQILKRKSCMPSKATNQPKSTVERGYIRPRGLLCSPAMTLAK